MSAYRYLLNVLAGQEFFSGSELRGPIPMTRVEVMLTHVEVIRMTRVVLASRSAGRLPHAHAERTPIGQARQ